jgi:thioredoxin reductase (NADPH)
MSDGIALGPAAPFARAEDVFPTLTPAQVARIGAHGRVRRTHPGEILYEAGEAAASFFVVVAGEVEIVWPTAEGEERVVVYAPGSFTGETNLISGRRSLVRARMSTAGEVIELGRPALLRLIRTDAELNAVLLRAFILRRVDLIAHGRGDVVLLGSAHCSGTHRVREFLTRNGHPYSYIDPDLDSSVQEMLDHFDVGPEDVPVLIGRGELVLRNPANREIAAALGFNAAIDPVQLRDVVVVGAGPSGLASALYAASEGLDVLVVETSAPGGQAGSSSRIENYLGFPMGISGQELTSRAHHQAEKFGAQVVVATGARRLSCERKPYHVELEDGTRVPTRTVIVATGAEYRKIDLDGMARFEGAGVYFAATFLEAQECREQEVVVVGGGNSAGQAAVFLAPSVGRVHLLVRGAGLDASMSRYLIQRIEDNPAIDLRLGTEIVSLEGDDHLEFVGWRGIGSGGREVRPIRHVFIMTGATPATRWLDGCLALDEKGFIRTGPSLLPDDLAAACWPVARPPHLLETSRPGVFAVGDVRAGNVKRVASAVGEGSIAVALVHQVIHE